MGPGHEKKEGLLCVHTPVASTWERECHTLKMHTKESI